MDKINDGGNAFPIPGLQNDAEFNGMTLRDYFAAKAMHALMMPAGPGMQLAQNKELADYAKRAYLAADAMLEARK